MRQIGIEFKIGKTPVGGKNPCFITAEIGINHDNKFDQAVKLIEVAAEAKCSAVKFQLFRAERMYARNAGKFRTALGKNKDIRKIIRSTELPLDWIPKLKRHANSKGLEMYSTVCDEMSGDVLAKYKMPAYKLASYEITHLPLFSQVAKKKKPVVFSTACAQMSEVAEVIELLKKERVKKIVVMHCMGKYPVELDDVNLGVIETFRLAFPDVIVGYSDHSVEPKEAPVAAVALGAKMIEKHITLDRKLSGPDHSFALEPKELNQMVRAVKRIEEKIKAGKKIRIAKNLLGGSQRITYPAEEYIREFAYRGVFAMTHIKKGERFSSKNLAVLRPGEKKNGLHPRFYSLLVDGYRAARGIKAASGISWADVLTK